MLEHPDDYEPAEVADAKNLVQDTLDGAFYGDQFFEASDEGSMPDFIGLADKVIEQLLAAGIQIPADLRSTTNV